MLTATQLRRFWSDTGTTSAVFTASEVEDIFAEAGELYTDNATAELAYTRVLAIRRLMASSAKLNDYRQGQSAESQSQIFKNLKELLQFWQGETATAVGEVASAASFGRTRRKPAAVKEYPGDA